LEGYCVALPKPTRKLIPSIAYSVIKHKGSMSLFKGYWSCPKLFNTPTIPLVGYPINTLGSITYLLKLEKVLHNPTKTYKNFNTFITLHYKHHGLNYFSLDYQRDIVLWQGIFNAHALPLVRYPKNTLGSITYLLKLAGVFLIIPIP
jgi:hypothetical protein